MTARIIVAPHFQAWRLVVADSEQHAELHHRREGAWGVALPEVPVPLALVSVSDRPRWGRFYVMRWHGHPYSAESDYIMRVHSMREVFRRVSPLPLNLYGRGGEALRAAVRCGCRARPVAVTAAEFEQRVILGPPGAGYGWWQA